MNSSTQDHTDLEWRPLVLTREKIQSLWEKIQSFPEMFDDLSRKDSNAFMERLMDRNSLYWEIGDEVGLATATHIRPRVDAIVHLIMFDRRLRGREGILKEILADLFQLAQLRRVTAITPTDRTPTTRKLLERLGFVREGVMRDALLVDGKYFNLDVYGMLREEL